MAHCPRVRRRCASRRVQVAFGTATSSDRPSSGDQGPRTHLTQGARLTRLAVVCAGGVASQPGVGVRRSRLCRRHKDPFQLSGPLPRPDCRRPGPRRGSVHAPRVTAGELLHGAAGDVAHEVANLAQRCSGATQQRLLRAHCGPRHAERSVSAQDAVSDAQNWRRVRRRGPRRREPRPCAGSRTSAVISHVLVIHRLRDAQVTAVRIVSDSNGQSRTAGARCVRTKPRHAEPGGTHSEAGHDCEDCRVSCKLGTLEAVAASYTYRRSERQDEG